MSIRIISLNVRGLQNANKRHALFNYARKRADVICFQETHSTPDDEKWWKIEWGNKIFFFTRIQ